MGTTYVVNTSNGSLNVRSGPGTSYPTVGTKSNGSTVSSNDERNGWIKISSSSDQWVSKSYLKPVIIDTKDALAYSSNEAIQAIVKRSSSTTDYSDDVFEGAGLDTASDDIQKEIRKTMKAFGAPPRYLESTDPHYIDDIPAGRVYQDTIMSHPTILSLMPCVVRYLPKFNKEEQTKFLNRVTAMAGNLADKITADDKLSGPLYSATSAYNAYMKSVNLLCRTVAIYLGLGNVQVPGSNTTYKHYDWSYHTAREEMANQGGLQGIFELITEVDDVVKGDSAYVHFFCNQPGVDISESISNSTRDSAIASLFNSTIDDVAKDLNYLLGGGGLSAEANIEVDNVLTAFGDNTFSTLLKYGKEYFNGARMQFPQMIDSMTYGKSMSVNIRFAASSGSVEAIYREIFVPVCHLLAFGLPRQVNENQYTYPFLCRAMCPGRYNSDLSVITDISVDKGGDGGRWTINNLPTEVDVSFTITPLFSQLMLSSTDHPLLFLKNTPLIDYLSVMCGIDCTDNNMQTKAEAIFSAVTGYFTNRPANLARAAADNKFVNMAGQFARSLGI